MNAPNRKQLLRVAFMTALLLAAWTVFNGGRTTLMAAEETTHAAGSNTASAEGEKHEAEDETAAFKHSASVQFIAKHTGLSIEQAYWVCVVANFAVIAGLLGWALKKSLPGMFRGRTASIQKAMAEARATSEDANRRLADIESRLSRLDGEISEMRGAAEMETQAEEQRIKSGTAEDVRKVVESAEQEIAAAAKFARRELQAFAAELVVNMAEKQVRVDAATDQALVKGFSQQLAADGKKDGR